MAYCSSYYLYQRYEKRGDQDWIPSYPNVYSIDGEGSKPLRARQMYDTDCGWIPDTEPIYRWTEITPTSDPSTYLCDDCPLTNMKLSANYSDSTIYNVDCNSSTTLSQTEVRGHSTAYSSMTSAEIGNCVTSIGTECFRNCSGLTSCTIGSGVTSIGINAFWGCKGLTSIDIPNSVTSIGDYTFGYCSSLTSIDIPSGVTRISDGTFYYCSGLTSIDIPNSVTSIGTFAFAGCSGLTSCTIGSGVTSIGYSAFHYCNRLTSVNIPNSVTDIGSYAFANCSSLTSCTIGSGVTSIGGYAFLSCSGLTSVTVNATTPPSLYTTAFYDTNNCPIYVPCESVEAYKSASGWSSYASRIHGIEPCGDYSTQYLTFVAIDSGTFSFSGTSSSTINNSSIEYSLDSGSTWYMLNRGVQSPTITSGNKIMWKSSTLRPVTGAPSGIGKFSSTGRFNIECNIMSLLYGDNFSNQTSLSNYTEAFNHLFELSNVVSAENLILPATTLSEACYSSMFQSCSGLTTPPQLPATALENYCYAGMFAYCQSLTTAPSLPATTLKQGCYSGMFTGCALVTTAPELPAIEVKSECYLSMFSGCTSLNYVKCLATSLTGTLPTYNWLNNVASSGTFVKNSSMSNWTRGNSGIPSGWTIQNAT